MSITISIGSEGGGGVLQGALNLPGAVKGKGESTGKDVKPGALPVNSQGTKLVTPEVETEPTAFAKAPAARDPETEQTKQEPLPQIKTAGSELTETIIDRLAVDLKSLFNDMASGLSLHIDRDTNKVIMRIVDSETNEVIKQIPSEEMLALSKKLGEIADSYSTRDKDFTSIFNDTLATG